MGACKGSYSPHWRPVNNEPVVGAIQHNEGSCGFEVVAQAHLLSG